MKPSRKLTVCSTFSEEASVKPPVIAVLITTYQRPTYLRGCLQSVAGQRVVPNYLVVVVRDTDVDTLSVIKDFQAAASWMKIKVATVTEPGPVPAIKRGFEFLRTCDDVDLVAVIDDDAEALPDWISVLTRNFSDPSVGVVAGRYLMGHRPDLPRAKKVATVTWYGRHIGDMYKPISFSETVEAESFMGGNFAIRRELLSAIEPDTRFTGNAIEYELDLAFQVRKLGYRIVFDPLAGVHHLDAPRGSGIEPRGVTQSLIYSYSHNHTLVMMRYLPLVRKLAFLVYFFLIGERHSWGVATIIADAILKRRLSCRGQAGPSFKGKLDGLRTYFKWKREGSANNANRH